jgi:hypothetical protein
MTHRIDTAPLITDDDIEIRLRGQLTSADQHRFWLVFLDACHRQIPTLVPVDGIPPSPAADDGQRLAPMLEWLVDMYAASALVIVLERPGPATATARDMDWVRCLRLAAAHADIPTRGALLRHDDGLRWIAPDEWIA